MNGQHSEQGFFTTRELAGLMRIEIGTAYKRISAFGDFWGVHPVRGPNGRLLWPADEVRALLSKQAEQV
jgi:hypothetical protein